MLLGVVVTTWNTLNFLKAMLPTARTRYPYHLIIVDNNSSDGIDEWIKSQLGDSQLHFVKQSSCKSMGMNRNAGMRLARELGATHIVMTHEDVLLHKDCIDNLVFELERHPKWLMACARPVFPFDLPEAWYRIVAPVREWYSDAYVDPETMDREGLKSVLEHSSEAAAILDSFAVVENEYSTPIPTVSCFRSDLPEMVGYYDVGFTDATYEDADLMHRCGLSVGSWDIRWTTRMSLYLHWGGGSLFNNGIDLRPVRTRVMSANESRYVSKWGGPLLQEKFESPVSQPGLWGTEYTYPNATERLKLVEGVQ